jgi:hypothetical protein
VAACLRSAAQPAPSAARFLPEYIGRGHQGSSSTDGMSAQALKALKDLYLVPDRPTGKERMRRRAPSFRWGAGKGESGINVKEVFSDDQLKEIGAILLEWSEIEEWTEVIFAGALDLDSSISARVAKSVNGLDARFSIIRIALQNIRLPADINKAAITTMADLSEYKKIRDLLSHCRMWNDQLGIAHSQNYEAQTYEVLVTISALTAYYDRMSAIKSELLDIGGIFSAVSARVTWFNLQSISTGARPFQKHNGGDQPF